ncbi:MAG: N-acetylmuramoyl-L-alanine amidase [Alphaproteobacteria bacterium]|nr:N-acetylmuramoyl-L-alanine amidase [Alphaproteobacteria bacterium]MBU1513516.1 N-acetylmuramoyl-L-alanine amidase [Alphaproteobacteria bacterium]MBU2094839.1 N-acetylmuramoyl-L-alanine amidase [Alphaproteobacteria bacterium]MBU2151096.1 N-acetylmuramoyl-L-alanine amidase [Alphaproteobacteria bacterium]MBU2309379.1 N-acetylmuramoyl-L-alanine amidase [Alphaproteobacteria bacterium]
MVGRLRGVVRQGRGRIVAACAAVAVGLAAFAVGHAATETAALIKVRMGGDSAETRLVIDLDGATSAKVVSDGAVDRRVVIMLPNVIAGATQQGAGKGVVRAWMVDQVQGGARLQLDLAGDAKLKRRFLLPPADGVANYRYVIDVAASQPGAVMTSTTVAAAATPVAPIRTQFVPAKKPALPLKKVVVIDAGHGGRDVGASGVAGHEKDVNLAAALTLADQLSRTGRYKVVLTRTSDVYVPLEDRVRVAQRAGADLFISLHSDSAPETNLKGASVYTLSDKASSRATKFVSRDDWFMKASLSGDQGVRDILFDLTQRATRNRSAVFAQTLVSSIEGKAPMLRHSHRDAGFMVLLAPDVPAVLLEMGFVNNPEDEARLRDPAARARLMRAVAGAIETHFGEQMKLASR